MRPLLHIIAALQPLQLRTENVVKTCAAFLTWQEFEVTQCIDELESAGLLIRSGRMYRIAPDMFADFLLEQAAVSSTGASNGYADALYKHFGSDYLAHLLQNIAELDFRVVDEGSPSLLANVWNDITVQFQNSDNYQKIQLLKGIEPAAFYQPNPVMQLVRLARQLPQSTTASEQNSDESFDFSNQDVLNSLPSILRAVAYQPAFREEAVKVLWQLAKSDSRRPNSYPEHALGEQMCAMLRSGRMQTIFKGVDQNEKKNPYDRQCQYDGDFPSH